MSLYRVIKRVVPRALKAKLRPTKTLARDFNNAAVRVWNRLTGGIPIPPGDFIYLVVGHRSASRFLKRGRVVNKIIRNIAEKNGVQVEQLNAILDFGCGVGRITRHWALPKHIALHGTDYNSELVDWCRENLKFGEFRVNTLSGELPYASETFDFIYAFSVFTHLDEQLQHFWIKELSRVLKPGGYLAFTVHGAFYCSQLTVGEQEKFRNGELVVRSGEQSGSNLCATFHPTMYVRENIARSLAVVDFIPGPVASDVPHDIYLLKKPI